MNWRVGRRGAIALGAVLYATLALASGLDRYSAHVPSAARLVPAPFQAEAAKRTAGVAVARGDTASAGDLAGRALRRAPLDAQAVALVAAVHGLRKEVLASEDALRVANMLGWRDPMSQQALFKTNLNEEQLALAATRLDVLLRVGAQDDEVHPMLTALEATPQGRAELMRRLATAPQWAAAYLSAFDGSDEVLRERSALLASPEAAQVRLGCDAVRPMVEELASRSYRREAEALARRQCPRLGGGALVADSDFTRFAGDDTSALGWRRQASGDVRVTPVERGVEIANSASVTRLVLTQPVALNAGSYRLAGRVSGLDPSLLVATLGCGQPAAPGERAGSAIGGGGQTLVAQGCDNEVLGLWLRPGNGALTVGGLVLKPN